MAAEEVESHYCAGCGRLPSEHPGECYLDEVDVPYDRGRFHIHGLPLCCADCPCLSFEQAHPSAVGTSLESLAGIVASDPLSTRTRTLLMSNDILTVERLAWWGWHHSPQVHLLKGIGRASLFEVARLKFVVSTAVAHHGLVLRPLPEAPDFDLRSTLFFYDAQEATG